MAKKVDTETLLSEFKLAKTDLEQKLYELDQAEEAYNRSLITLEDLRIIYHKALREYIINSHEPYSHKESEARASYSNQSNNVRIAKKNLNEKAYAVKKAKKVYKKLKAALEKSEGNLQKQ